MITSNIQIASYLLASILFILSLSGLSSQETAKRGVLFGIIGMTIAILATVFGENVQGYTYIIVAIIIASIIGVLVARKVEMTAMPQLIAILHSFVGLAAVLVGFGSFIDPEVAKLQGAEMIIHMVEVYIGIFIGAITFTGSVIAWGKLTGKISGKPFVFKGNDALNAVLFIATIVLGVLFIQNLGSPMAMNILYIMTAIAAFFGIMMVMAIGGADMPVVISMLNSLSGWTASAAGFMLGNDLLIVTGALVGSSGAILSIIMCEAMNRPFFSVILGGFGQEIKTGKKLEDTVKYTTHENVAEKLTDAERELIVHG